MIREPEWDEVWTPLTHPMDFLDYWLSLANPDNLGLLQKELNYWFSQMTEAWYSQGEDETFEDALVRVTRADILKGIAKADTVRKLKSGRT